MNRELTGGLVFLAVGAAGLFWATDLPFGNASLPGPAMLPSALSALMIAFAGMLALRALRRGAGPHSDAARSGPVDRGVGGVADTLAAPSPPSPQAGYRRVALAAALLAAYVPALRPLGFVGTTFVCMSALYAIADKQPFGLRPVISGAILTAATYVLFRVLLDVPLPEGTLWK